MLEEAWTFTCSVVCPFAGQPEYQADIYRALFWGRDSLSPSSLEGVGSKPSSPEPIVLILWDKAVV